MDQYATRVVISHPDELSTWGRSQLDTDRFKGYLRKTMGTVDVGYEWEEFADVGCCGTTLDIPLRVESFDGGPEVGPDTEIEFTERPASMRGGWYVQSAGAPER